MIVILLCLGIAAADAGDAEMLVFSGDGVANLDFLSEYPNLKTLTLTDCPAYDLTPIASCSRLTSLTIQWSDGYSGNGTYDLSPLGQCQRLTTLALIGPGIEDLTALTGVERLSTLTVDSTAVADYSPIVGLNLKHLRLFGADAESLVTVFSSIGRKLESAAVGDCVLTPEASDAILTGTRLISLSFSNAEGIDGESDRWQNLNNLTCLSVFGGSVSSLSFLDSYVSTVVVKLENVLVGGARCTVDFDKYFLTLHNVPPEEILKLVKGDGRRWLYAIVRLQHENVSGALLSAFANVSGLLSLDLQAVDLAALSPDIMESFKTLEQLKLSDCTAISLAMLGELPYLQRLYIKNATIGDVQFISYARRLQQLSLVNCTVDDWTFLDELSNTAITLLSLSGCNGPESIEFIRNLQTLKILALEDSPVIDLEPLNGLQLTSLYLYGCNITDYTPLTALISLERLYCNEDADLPTLSCRIERRSAATE